MKLYSTMFVGALILLILSCSSVTVKTDYDKSVDFSKLKTYRILDQPLEGDALSSAPLVKKRVLSSIERAMNAKGFTKTDAEDSDMLVVAHGATKEKMQVTNTGGYGYGWYDPWWGPYGGSTSVSYYDEGTLVVDIVDVAEKELAWRGTATGVIKGEQNQEKQQRNIDAVIDKILATFPPSGS